MPSINRLVKVKDLAVIVERAAAFVTPGADHGGDAACRVHIDRAVARTRKSIAEPEVRALVLGDEVGESFDGFDGQPVIRDAHSGSRVRKCSASFPRRVGVALEIFPIRLVVAKQAMHHRAGERAVGAGPDQHRQVGLPHGAVHVDVDGDDLGAALFAGARRVRHHVDLGVHRIGAPDHHQIGLRHFARIGAGKLAGAGDEAGPGRIDADGREEAGIFFGMPQPMDAVAHDVAHGAGIVVRPDRLRAVGLLGAQELLGDEIERVVPRDRRELAAAFGAGAAQRMLQAIGVMNALGVARDLGADDARGVGVVLGAPDPADGVVCRRPRLRARRSRDNRAGRQTRRLWGGRPDLS